MSYNNTCKIRLVLWKACEGMKPITLSHRASSEKGEAEHRCHILSHIFPCTWGEKKKKALTKNVCWGSGGTDVFLFSLFLREKFPICLMKKKNPNPKPKNPKPLLKSFVEKQRLRQFLLKVNLRFPTVSLK